MARRQSGLSLDGEVMGIVILLGKSLPVNTTVQDLSVAGGTERISRKR